MVRKSLIIKGKVQGVGFRFFNKLSCNGLMLTGFAKNLDNNDVLVEVQGNLSDIDKLINILYRGNGFCKVSSIKITDITLISNEKNFNMY